MSISSFIQISSLLPRNIIISAVRSILLGLDSILYTFIGFIFSGIFSIANLDQIDVIAELYSSIQERVYVILGIVMLFKVTMTLLTYLVNPDMMTNKEQGANKLVLKIITSLVLLIVVPTIVFPMLNRIQLPLLNTVGKVITGNINNFDDNSSVLGAGQEAALSLISTFFYIDDGCAGNSTPESYEIKFITDITEKADAACINADGSLNKDKYQYTYIYGVSSLIALISVVILIIIGINVAIRAFKLIVLKLIAPVPILSYITTKSGKDSMLNSYIKLFTTTYLDLFVQFGIFYLVMTIFARLESLETKLSIGVGFFMSGGIFTWPLVFIGLLIFALMAPKFIKKALNIKDSEFGTGIAGMLTTGSILAHSIGSGVAAATGRGGTTFQNVGAGIAGAIRGTTAGARAGFGSGKTDYSKVSKAMQEANVRMATERESGSTFDGRLRASLGNIFLGTNAAQTLEVEVKNMQSLVEAVEKGMKRAEGEMEKSDKTYGSIYDGSNIYTNWKDFQARMTAAKAEGRSYVEYIGRDQNGNVTGTYQMSLTDAELNAGWIKKENTANYIDQAMDVNNNVIVDQQLVEFTNDTNNKLGALDLGQINSKLDDIGMKQIKNQLKSRSDMKAVTDGLAVVMTQKKRELNVAKADANLASKK